MKIDLRLFIPVIAPFAVLGLTRAVCFVAGAEWSEPEIAAFLALFLGLGVSFCVLGFMFSEGIEIGHIRIGKRKDQG